MVILRVLGGREYSFVAGLHEPPSIILPAMRAMILRSLGRIEEENGAPLVPAELPDPVPGPGEVRIRVAVCGVCHTELDEIEGRTPPPRLPIVLGHQVVGRVDALGAGVTSRREGDRVGVAWIYSSCGHCKL